VQRDTNQYKTLSRFGACLTLNVGQTLDSGVAGTVASANTPLVVENFNPNVLVHAFVRAGVAPVAVTIDGVHYSVLSAFASTGHYELYLDVVTTNVTQGKAVLSAVLEAELARIVALP
jgi:hypothetical protein